MVAFAYLDAVEGPLWTAVRGTGLAYGTSFSRNVESGHISFNIYRSPNTLGAFNASKIVVEDFANGKTEFGVLALEGAVSSIVLGIATEQASMDSAAQASFARQVVYGLPGDWNDRILKMVRDVSVNEVKAVMKEIILPVFESATANLVITCAPIMEEVSIFSIQFPYTRTSLFSHPYTLSFFQTHSLNPSTSLPLVKSSLSSRITYHTTPYPTEKKHN